MTFFLDAKGKAAVSDRNAKTILMKKGENGGKTAAKMIIGAKNQIEPTVANYHEYYDL